LKNSQSHIYDLEFESATIDGVHYARDQKGIWRYADTWIPVPGARDLKLSERFETKEVVSRTGDIERVIVSGDSIRESPELLEWCVEEGEPIYGPEGELKEVFVAHEVWMTKDRVPGALVAPEHSSDDAKRQLALVERKYREADQALEDAAVARANVLRSLVGRLTRQQAREITGLSIGRIQQLIRPEKLTELEVGVLGILAVKGGRSAGSVQELAQKRFPRTDTSAIDGVLRGLVARGLIKGGETIRLTDKGREMAPSRDGAEGASRSKERRGRS